jgi:hypothetical protein
VQLSQKPEVRSEVCNTCSVVAGTFGVSSLLRVTHCYSYSKIKNVLIIVIPPGEYPVNRVSNPEPTSYLSCYLANSQQYKTQYIFVFERTMTDVTE